MVGRARGVSQKAVNHGIPRVPRVWRAKLQRVPALVMQRHRLSGLRRIRAAPHSALDMPDASGDARLILCRATF
jgi:hypothetical protein